ncbi:MAG: DNA-binding transcriptional LysR family regulator [Paraglaciecola sp.]|jgi:DNA-binding transcriptional LysR family regulator
MLANDLILFSQVVKLGSFSKVAETNNLTNSVVSKHIARLEKELGVQLLYRTTRRLTLTEAGRALVQQAEMISQITAEAVDTASGFSEKVCGHIRMSIPTISGELFLTECIAEFGQRYPDLSIEVSLENEFVDLIKEGIDLAIRTGVLDDSSLIAKSLITSHWVVCCSPKYIEKHGTPQVPTDLVQHNCLAYTYQNQGAHEWRFSQGEHQQQVKISGSFATNNSQALRTLALAGYGIAYIPKCSVYQDLNKGLLIELLPDYKPRELGVYAIYPYTKHLPLKIKLLIDHIKQGYENLSHYF